MPRVHLRLGWSLNSQTLADQTGTLWNNPSGRGRGERPEEGLKLAMKCPSPDSMPFPFTAHWPKQVLCRHAKLLQLCLTLCDPMDYSPPGSSVHGILQARRLEWGAISFSRGSSQPREMQMGSLLFLFAKSGNPTQDQTLVIVLSSGSVLVGLR